jgi:O-antigen ligase/Flp pilus assembly protein TadD
MANVRVGVVGLVGLAPFVMVPSGFEPAQLPQAAFVQVGTLILAVLALWSGAGLVPPWRARPFGAPLVAFLAWGALSAAWAVNVREVVQTWSHWAACALLYVIVCSVFRRDELRPLVVAVFLAGVGVAGLGIVQHLFGVQWVPQAIPPAATFMNKNMAAGFVVGAWPLGLALAATSRAAVPYALGSAVQLAYLFYTFTKSGWVAVAVQAVLLLLFAAFPRRARTVPPRAWLAPAAGAALLLVLVNVGPRGGPAAAWRSVRETWAGAPVIGPDRPLAGMGDHDRDNSLRARRAIWTNTAAMVAEDPLLGTGLGNHKVHYPAYARRWAIDPRFGRAAQLDHVHNDYLQVLAELGLVGLGLGGWLLFAVGRVARRQAADRSGGFATVGVVLGLSGILVDGVFSFPLQRAIPTLTLAVFLGVLAVLARGHAEEPRPGRAVVARAGLLLALAVAGAAHFRVLSADRHVWRARQAEARGDWVDVLNAARPAVRRDPGRKEALFAAGTALLMLDQGRPAVALLGALVRRYPYDPPGLGNLALAQEADRQAEAALATYARLVAVLPEDVSVAGSRARLLEQTGRWAEAGEAYHRVAQLDPADPRPPLRAGIMALRAQRPGDAVPELQEAVRRKPDLAEAHKALGLALYEGLGRKEEGRVHVQRALELRPEDRDAPRMKQLLAAR